MKRKVCDNFMLKKEKSNPVQPHQLAHKRNMEDAAKIGALKRREKRDLCRT